MTYVVKVPVATAVIPIAEIRTQLRIDLLGASSHEDDTLLNLYLSAAREQAEHHTQRSVGEQTLELALDSFPEGGIELPLGAATIESITYVDANQQEITLDSNLYTLDNYQQKHWALPEDAWPETAEVANAVKVLYKTPSDFPAAVKTAMLMHIAFMYENREAVNVGNIVSKLPLGYEDLLNTRRRWAI